jgi:ribosome-associated protein
MTGVAVSLPINLGQFLKVAGMAGSGGDAKSLIASGGVLVNGQTEQRRGHKLQFGDIVEVSGAVLRVEERASADKKAPDGSRGRPGA